MPLIRVCPRLPADPPLQLRLVQPSWGPQPEAKTDAPCSLSRLNSFRLPVFWPWAMLQNLHFWSFCVFRVVVCFISIRL